MEEQQKSNLNAKLTMGEFREDLKEIYDKARKDGYTLEYRLNSNYLRRGNGTDPNYALIARNENADIRFSYNVAEQVYVASISKDDLSNEGIRIHINSNQGANSGSSKNHATKRPILNISAIRSTTVDIFRDFLDIYSVKNYGKKNSGKYVSRNPK